MKKEIKCYNCGHEWLTNSTLVMVTCPSCIFKVKNTSQASNQEFKDTQEREQ